MNRQDVYDPLGMVSPFMLKSKRLLKHLCCHDTGWDEKLSNDLQQRCQKATVKLTTLQTIQVPVCFHPVSFNVEKASLHLSYNFLTHLTSYMDTVCTYK